MNKLFPFISVIALLLSVSGCRSTYTAEPGYYGGTNPDVSFQIVYVNYPDEKYDIENLNIILTDNVGNVSYTCTDQLDITPIHPDGSFSYRENNKIITGVVSGGNVHGHYTNDQCYILSGDYPYKSLEFDQTVQTRIDANWTASYSGYLPTSTPLHLPTLGSIPPKLGHYDGTIENGKVSISFNVTSSGIENFIFEYGTTCPVHETDVLLIAPSGSFLVQEEGTDVTINGNINGGTVRGTYSFKNVCTAFCEGGFCKWSPGADKSGDWSANWVSP